MHHLQTMQENYFEICTCWGRGPNSGATWLRWSSGFQSELYCYVLLVFAYESSCWKLSNSDPWLQVSKSWVAFSEQQFTTSENMRMLAVEASQTFGSWPWSGRILSLSVYRPNWRFLKEDARNNMFSSNTNSPFWKIWMYSQAQKVQTHASIYYYDYVYILGI